jgi:uncharacterized pyridoxamine 5'-phosphate oxidase family protein
MKKFVLILFTTLLLSCQKDYYISLDLYPNPVSSYLTIDYKMSNNYTLIITDSNNKEYYRKRIDNKEGELTIDMSDFENKFYYIRILGDDSFSVRIEKI